MVLLAVSALPQLAPISKKGPLPTTGVMKAILLGPEPLLVRVNGTKALTEKVFPVMAEKSGQLSKDINKIEVAQYDATVMGFGGSMHTWVEDLKLRVPIEADDLKATFQNASGNKAKIDSTYNFNKASLTLKFKVHSQGKSPFQPITPDFVKKMMQLNDTFNIELKGVSGELDLTGKRSGNGIVIDSVDKFSIQLSSVSITDTGVVTEIANAFLGLDKLFNVVGASNVNDAAKKLVNKLLSQNLGIEGRIKAAANEAIKAIDTQSFTHQNLAISPNTRMNVEATFKSLDSMVNNVKSEFSLAMTASPNGKVPGLSFSTPQRDAEDITLPNSTGDLQAFIPYTLIDKAMFEVIQAGLFQKFDVPAQGGITQAFTMKLTPTQVPHANRDPNSTRNVALTFAAKMEDTTVGNIKIGGAVAGTPIGKNVALTTVNATANVTILLQVKADDNSGIYLDIQDVKLDSLSGQLMVGKVATDLANHKALLQNVLASTMKSGMPKLVLMSRTMNLVAPLRVQVGTPSLGTQYVRVPLTILTS